MAKLTFILEDESGNNTTMTRTRTKGDWYYHELSDFLENVFDELGEDLKHELNVQIKIGKKIGKGPDDA